MKLIKKQKVGASITDSLANLSVIGIFQTVEIAKVRTKAEKYGADPNIVEALYREMISRFVNMELSEFHKNMQ